MRSSRHSASHDTHSLRSRDAKRILEYLNERKSGAEVHMISRGLGIHFHRVMSILKNDLEPAGEVWRKGNTDEGLWYLTAAYVPTREPEEIVRDLKRELERDIFGGVPPPWVNEFAAGIRAGLSIGDAWIFAQRKIIEAHPELRARTGVVGAET